ncbi:MAG: histidinol phosphate phosphatase [Planctomycetes bacterium]|nr:histidinol phosphate phosphatase [Planctomycetota bacterium]
MTDADIQARLDFALDASREAAEFILGYFQTDKLQTELKGDRTPVTVADRGAEDLLRTRVAATFPGDGFLGEERGETASSSGFRWIVDPIDGTKSFVHGVPLFGTLVGFEFEGDLVGGVCRMPALDEVVYARRGGGAWWQCGGAAPQAARVSNVSQLSDALCCTTTVTGWKTIGGEDVFERLCGAVRLVRGWGDCYGHLLVATGRAEFIVEPQMSPWDAAALVPILEEAGGHYLDWQGRRRIDSGNGLSVNAVLKDAVLGIIGKPHAS